jgi:hypothetical protein
VFSWVIPLPREGLRYGFWIITREEKFASRMGSKYEWQGDFALNFGK